MPGQTDNTLALAAINQVVVALNEIVAQFNTGGDPDGLAVNLELAAENIDAVRVALETGQAAAVVAQNTNFSDLNATIAALKLICAPQIKLVVQSGIPSPFYPPTEPGTEFDTPPGGYEDTTETPGSAPYYDRKCKISSLLVDNTRKNIQWLDDWGLDTITNIEYAIFLSAMTGLLSYMATGSSGVAAIFASYVGGMTQLMETLWDNIDNLDFGELLTALDAHRDELVCGFYEAGSAGEARSNYIQILDDNGVSLVNQTVMAVGFFDDTILNHLFYQGEEALEAELALYTPPGGCDDCGVFVNVVYGNVTSGTPNANGTPFTVESENTGDPPGQCGELDQLQVLTSIPCDFTITINNQVYPTDTGCYPYPYSYFDDQGQLQQFTTTPSSPHSEDNATGVYLVHQFDATPKMTITFIITPVV